MIIWGTQQNNTDFQPARRRRIYAKQNCAGGDDHRKGRKIAGKIAFPERNTKWQSNLAVEILYDHRCA